MFASWDVKALALPVCCSRAVQFGEATGAAMQDYYGIGVYFCAMPALRGGFLSLCELHQAFHAPCFAVQPASRALSGSLSWWVFCVCGLYFLYGFWLS